MNELVDLSPKSLDEAMKLADMLANSSIVPKDFVGKPGNIIVAIQWGAEIGLKPMQAMQGIAVVNGRPTIWGDAALALVLASPVCKDVLEFYEGDGDDYKAVCIAQRHGKEDKRQEFSIKDAKAAGLFGKQGPWTQYRDRMLQMRARSFGLRDQFADVLKGMSIREEVSDFTHIEKDITPAKQTPIQIAQKAADAVRPERTERHVSIIAALETVAKELGFEPLKEEWSKLQKEDRAAIGMVELNRIKEIALSGAVQTVDENGVIENGAREAGADDE